MKILKILKVTQEAYEAMLLDTYMSWCMDFVTDYEKELQKLVGNRSINKWFLQELGKLENKFIEEHAPYAETIDSATARENYADATDPIFRRFPKTLIEEAKKSLTINNDTDYANS